LALKGLFRGVSDTIADLSLDQVRANLDAAFEMMEKAERTGQPPPEFGVRPDVYFRAGQSNALPQHPLSPR
jgi:hypothetical protein